MDGVEGHGREAGGELAGEDYLPVVEEFQIQRFVVDDGDDVTVLCDEDGTDLWGEFGGGDQVGEVGEDIGQEGVEAGSRLGGEN